MGRWYGVVTMSDPQIIVGIILGVPIGMVIEWRLRVLAHAMWARSRRGRSP